MKNPNHGVPKRFDDQLEALLGYIAQKGWTVTGVNIDELASDLTSQRAERQTKLDLERQTASASEAFFRNQTARYGRYMKALEVLRAAHRDEPEVQKALLQFKREVKRAVVAPSPASGEAEAE